MDLEAQQDTPPLSHLIPVSGAFDLPAALRVRDAIAVAPAGEALVIDFTHAPIVQDLALAALVHALAGLNRQVTTRGLSQHHHTLLRYLGSTPARRPGPVGVA